MLNTSESKDIIYVMSVILLSEILKSFFLESQKPSETWYIKYNM